MSSADCGIVGFIARLRCVDLGRFVFCSQRGGICHNCGVDMVCNDGSGGIGHGNDFAAHGLGLSHWADGGVGRINLSSNPFQY